MGTGVVGREEELRALVAFLDEAGPQVLVVQGEAGIGKTTVWRHAVDAARAGGAVVLAARPLELERSIPFAGLGDLLGDVLGDPASDPGTRDALAALPEPQRRALEAALLLGGVDEPPVDPSRIPVAFLAGLRSLARSSPVLVAVDDVQWLDEPTAAALRFAARRLEQLPVRVLLAQRTTGSGALPLDLDRALDRSAVTRVSLGGMSMGALQRILRRELDVQLPRGQLARIHDASGGNPFFGLELTRALTRHEAELEPGAPLPLPETLQALLADRLAALPPPALGVAEIAALLRAPTAELVEAAGVRHADLLAAVAAQVISLGGSRIAFAHPLLVSAVVAGIDPERRRALHRRLAGLVAEPEERARHLALGADGPDAAVAAALDEAARLARARGAPDTAAELLEQALVLTPREDRGGRAHRLTAAAEALQASGDWERASTLAAEAVEALPAGSARARSLMILGEVRSDSALVAHALDACDGGDDELRARIGITLAAQYATHDFRAAVGAAERAVEDAVRAGRDVLAVQALATLAWFEAAGGRGDAAASLARIGRHGGVDLHDIQGQYTPDYTLASIHMWRDEHDAARERFARVLEHDERRGDVWGQAHVFQHLAQVEWRRGDWAAALEQAELHASLVPPYDWSGRATRLWIDAVLHAHGGRLDAAVEAAELGLRELGAASEANPRLGARFEWVLGLVALERDDPEAALPRLERCRTVFDEVGVAEPGMRLFESDLLEALVELGRPDDAAARAAALERDGARLGSLRALAIGARGRGLVHAVRGELDEALAALGASAAAAPAWDVPFEHGRTLLALGAVQRRTRRRREARATLAEALALFERLGATVFAARARGELARIGGRTPSGQALTAGERRVAEHAARGLTNREIAAELVISVHTVEAALTRAYGKLGVRSRTELARLLAGSPPDPAASAGPAGATKL